MTPDKKFNLKHKYSREKKIEELLRIKHPHAN